MNDTDNGPQGLIERWQERQQQLAELLEACGATDGERRIDWVTGRVTWLGEGGATLASAEMKALCSYAFDDESLMMAWANEGLEQGAVIAPLPEVPDFIEACGEAEAWLWAMRLADESRASYLYRVAGAEYLVFLGLWNFRATLAADDVEAGSPQAFVLELLDGVTTALHEQADEPAALRRLFINRGESLLQNAQYLYSDRSDGGLLRRTGNALIEMGSSFGQRRFGLLPPAPLSEVDREEITMQLARLRANWIQAGRQQRRRDATGS